MTTLNEYLEKALKNMPEKKVNEGQVKLTFGGYHLKDNILDEMTIEELRDTIEMNTPTDKINKQTIMKEFESILKGKINDARYIVKKILPELEKELKS
jgi:hypothetical protein